MLVVLDISSDSIVGLRGFWASVTRSEVQRLELAWKRLLSQTRSSYASSHVLSRATRGPCVELGRLLGANMRGWGEPYW